jgi:ubiquinone/menaquinone biosynthesis C-methylase UbiE
MADKDARDRAENPWDERAQAYRDSPSHSAGPDLELIVAWAGPGEDRTALDVGSGGGHLGRRLREAGFAVTTCDPSPAMWPDVICQAEDLPFAERSFDLVASRLAAHHFSDPKAALEAMARVTKGPVLVSDLRFIDDKVEQAEKTRDPSHVRAYSIEEWQELFAGAGLEVEATETVERQISFGAWLERCGCTGAEAKKVRRLLAHRLDGDDYTSSLVVLKGARR